MGNRLVESLSWFTRNTEQITQDIFIMNFRAVNAFIIRAKMNEWILIDTGLENSENYILQEAKSLFGKYSSPKAIVLTHGHKNHVGSLKALTRLWNVPAYIHPNEIPYITGRKSYLHQYHEPGEEPAAPVDIGFYAVPLPGDHSVPFADGWQWVFTPGHTQGHVSLYNNEDKILICGDAVATTNQDSLVSVITQQYKLYGPSADLTENYVRAWESVELLVRLKPSILLPSHGRPILNEAYIELNDGLLTDMDVLQEHRDGLS